jgi:hypothetical protein
METQEFVEMCDTKIITWKRELKASPNLNEDDKLRLRNKIQAQKSRKKARLRG